LLFIKRKRGYISRIADILGRHRDGQEGSYFLSLEEDGVVKEKRTIMVAFR